MNYPHDATVDIDALMLALTRQSQPLPHELQQQLTQTGEGFVANRPEAAKTLRDLIRSYSPLEAAYFDILKQWDKEYSSQERAKSLSAAFHMSQGFGFVFAQDILPTDDWVEAAQRMTRSSAQLSKNTASWIKRGNTTITMISGGAFLGVLLAQVPGAIIGGIIAGIFGWLTSKPKAV